MGKLVIDSTSIYEIDEECLKRKEATKKASKENKGMEKKEADRK